MFQSNVDKNSREYLTRKVSGARGTLLMVVIFTVVNLVLLLLQADTYFLFSASVPYYFTALGMGMDMGMGADGIGTFTITALVISAIILVLYFLCWLLAKKRPGWYIVAIVLFVIDTAAFLYMASQLDLLTSSIIDVVFHGWVLIELIQAVSANKKLQSMPEAVVDSEGDLVAEPVPAPAIPEDPWERKDIE